MGRCYYRWSPCRRAISYGPWQLKLICIVGWIVIGFVTAGFSVVKMNNLAQRLGLAFLIGFGNFENQTKQTKGRGIQKGFSFQNVLFTLYVKNDLTPTIYQKKDFFSILVTHYIGYSNSYTQSIVSFVIQQEYMITVLIQLFLED